MTQLADTFSNRYAIERELASGGMADVFLAHDQVLHRPVAVKVLFAEYARDPAFVERFRREAHSAANLNHPNIVNVYDWGQERGTYFIVMEYVEGQSLRDVIRAEGPLPEDEAARIAGEIADALAYAHHNGLVHRDVKPGNVLITPEGDVKLADLGIAAHGRDVDAALTQTGAVMGTATYFSPEQAQGYAVDGRSDVYALGVILYEMVTGNPPFTGESPVVVAMKHVREQPAAPSSLVPGLSPDLERIILTAMAKRVEHRYQSADELRTDLVQVQRGRPLEHAADAATSPFTDVVYDQDFTFPPTPPGKGRAVPPEPPRRRFGAVLWPMAGLGVLVALAVYAIAFGTGRGEGSAAIPIVRVPALITKPVDEATAQLRDAGLKVQVVEDPSSTQPPGTVIDQDPSGGERVQKGSTVVLTVSAIDAEVPDLVGKTYEDAVNALERLGFLVERLDEESPDKPEGTVLSTDPAATTRAPRGSTVTVHVAAAPGVLVPDVKNRALAQAQNLLVAAGFQIEVEQVTDDVVPEGTVVDTDPTAGTKVGNGSTVKILVSIGPASVEVPNVVGNTQTQAIDTLTARPLYFNVEVQPCVSPSSSTGRVVNQTPSGGVLPPHSTITIYVDTTNTAYSVCP